MARRRRRNIYVWLLKQKETADWDEVKGFVILARTEQRARELAKEDEAHEADECPDFWLNSDYSTCIKIGISKKKEGRWLRSFNSG